MTSTAANAPELSRGAECELLNQTAWGRRRPQRHLWKSTSARRGRNKRLLAQASIAVERPANRQLLLHRRFREQLRYPKSSSSASASG